MCPCSGVEKGKAEQMIEYMPETLKTIGEKLKQAGSFLAPDVYAHVAAWEADRTDRDALREDMALAVEIAQAHDLDLLASIESTKAIRASLPPEENEP